MENSGLETYRLIRDFLFDFENGVHCLVALRPLQVAGRGISTWAAYGTHLNRWGEDLGFGNDYLRKHRVK